MAFSHCSYPGLLPIRIGFVIIGAAGYMAGNFLRALVRAKQELSLRDVTVELLAVADPALMDSRARESRKKITQYARILNSRPTMHGQAQKAVDAVTLQKGGEGVSSADHVIVYDASPASMHSMHLNQILYSGNEKISYFGEKPIFIDPTVVKEIRRQKFAEFFCDFIETSNPAITTIKDFIKLNDLRITDLWFWRAGSSGIKKLVGHDQDGVEGGAILDKAPHDFSISEMLLEPSNVASCDVGAAEMLLLIPNERGEILNAENQFVLPTPEMFNVRSADGSRLKLPADGMSYVELDWHTVEDGIAKGRYLFSWLGYLGQKNEANAHAREKQILAELKSLGIVIDDLLMKEQCTGPYGRFMETQCRVCLITAVDRKGMKYRFVANLIMAESAQPQRIVQRWVTLFLPNSSAIKLQVANAATYKEQKIIDLAEIIKRVALGCHDERQAVYLGSKPTLDVHDTLLRARDKSVLDGLDRFKKNESQITETWSHVDSTMVK